MVDAIIQELNIRKNYLFDQKVHTIYFGGGTPSILSLQSIERVLEAISVLFDIENNVEITLEANPDDLNEKILRGFSKIGVNRLSIGIQSFDDKVLEWMNRAHNSEMANECIQHAKIAGISSINADLIFGVPNTEEDYIQGQLEKFLSLPIDHISAYQLTIEEKTKFGHLFKQGKLKELDDELAISQFYQVRDYLSNHDFEPYEISNFAKDSSYSKHNTSYWQGKTYLGVGPGAHSFNGSHRQFNISNNHLYIKGIVGDGDFFDEELLTPQMKYNEYLLTRLRTKWGVQLDEFESLFGPVGVEKLFQNIEKNDLKKYLDFKNNVILLKKNSLIIADFVTGELFI